MCEIVAILSPTHRTESTKSATTTTYMHAYLNCVLKFIPFLNLPTLSESHMSELLVSTILPLSTTHTRLYFRLLEVMPKPKTTTGSKLYAYLSNRQSVLI